MEAEKEVWGGRNFGIQGFGERFVTDLAMTAALWHRDKKKSPYQTVLYALRQYQTAHLFLLALRFVSGLNGPRCMWGSNISLVTLSLLFSS